MKPASRKQMRAAIQSKGIESALMVPKGTLTKKQRAFAEAIANGETGAAAYRAAYNTQASPQLQSHEALKLRNNPKIAQQIEALTLANEAMKYADAASIRQLVIQSLIQTVIDPDVKAATKVSAAKVLGSVTEIAAFTERKEITHVKNSGAIREQILDQLKSMMLSGNDVETVDATDLLAELTSNSADDYNSDNSEGTVDGDAQIEIGTPLSTMHTTPLKQSQKNSESSPIPMQIAEPTPSSLQNDNGGGYISKENEDVIK